MPCAVRHDHDPRMVDQQGMHRSQQHLGELGG
jgi:hypothetical protein